jgi:tetratricopeptide (TPR) repeat protein
MGLFDFLKKKPGDTNVPPVGPDPTPLPPSAGAADKPTPAPSPRPASTPAPAPPPKPAPPAAAGPESIETTDAFGRRVKLSREEYRTRVLPALLEAHGNDADRLSAVIVQGLRDGLARELIAAANRLVIVDKDLDRALSVLGVVQRDAGDMDAAEFTMQELLQKRPKSANARVGLAMLAEKRGDAARCVAMLWQALELDCNHADAVHCHLQMRHRAVGDDGYRAEIDKVAALPGSWRAQLWRARLDLQQGREAEASTTYRDVIARAGDETDALVMVSNDLVQGRHHALVDELIVPRFQPGRHHPNVGLALLHHFLATERHDPGADLLHQMHLHYGHMLGDQLQPFTAAFDRLRLAQMPAPAPPPANARVGLVRLDRPIWCAGLHDPLWLLPRKTGTAKQVVFAALASDGQPKVAAGREDELGRLTRGVPLLLAEHVWLSTPHRGTTWLPMVEQGGWALMGRPWQEEQLAQQFGDEERAHTILVTGLLRADGEQRRIDLWAYDCAARQRIGHAAAEGGPADLGRMQLQLIAELWPSFGGPAGHKPPVGDAAFWHRYGDGLAQHAALVAAQAGGMAKDRLYGERYVVQWLQQAALQEPRWQPGFWLYASGLCVLQQLGSKVPLEHARAVAEIFRQTPPAAPFARLAVCPLRAVGLDALWQSRRPEIVAAAAGDTNYLNWLQRVEAAK